MPVMAPNWRVKMNRSKISLSSFEKARVLEIVKESLENVQKKDWSAKRSSQMFQALADSISARLSREIVVVSPKIID